MRRGACTPSRTSFGPISGALQGTTLAGVGTLAASGQLRICLFVPGSTAAYLARTLSQTMNDVRIGIGIGGVISIGRTTILQQPPIDISLYGASWTVKTVSVSNRTDNGGITYLVERGFAHGAASLTSSTAATLGVLQLVTPTQHVVVGVPGNNDRSGSITRMTFHFLSPIPEPGPFLLLSTGAVGLALLGRARRRR